MYVVTGAAGFIGSAFVWKLNSLGVTDIVIVDDITHPAKKKNIEKLKYKELIGKKEFLTAVANEKFSPQIHALVHLGACSSTTEQDLKYLMNNNFEYSRSLALWAERHKIRFIYASSAATYGDGVFGYSDDDSVTERLRPMNGYGYSKHIFDLWALWTGRLARMAGLKFFNVFGPNEYHKEDMRSMVHKAYDQILSTGKVNLFKSLHPDYADGEQKRDFIYVKDCVDVMWWFVGNPRVTGIYNLGSGMARTWNDLVRSVFDAMKKTPFIKYIDIPEGIAKNYQYYTCADMKKLRSVGYSVPFKPLESAIKDYVQNYLTKKENHL